MRELDRILEAGASDGGPARRPVDLETVRNLVDTAAEEARNLAELLHNLPSHYSEQWQVDAANDYAAAAAATYGALLQRVSAVLEQLRRYDSETNAEAIAAVAAMLDDHPWRRA